MELEKVVGRGTEGVDRLVEEVELELMVVEGVFNSEAGLDAELELEVVAVVAVVKNLKLKVGELDNWTDEEALDRTGTLDD